MQEGDFTVDPVVLRELRDGEQPLWCGRPDPKRRIERGAGPDAFEWSVRLRLACLLVVAVLAAVSFFVQRLLPAAHTYTLLLVLAALLLLFSLAGSLPKYAKQRARRSDLQHIVYAITNQRILVISNYEGREGVHSYTRQDLGRIERIERHSDGCGDVIFGINQSGQGGQQAAAAARFIAIPDVRGVEALLLRTFKDVDNSVSG
jgi:hypothetical protein